MDDWRERAACKGKPTDMFFPEHVEPKEARAICAVCPVQQECLDYALRHSIRHGVWGGLSDKQRTPIRRAREVVSRVCHRCGVVFTKQRRAHGRHCPHCVEFLRRARERRASQTQRERAS